MQLHFFSNTMCTPQAKTVIIPKCVPHINFVNESTKIVHHFAYVIFQAAVVVLKNGERVMTVWAESVLSWGTSSNVAVLQLAKGDRVWVSLRSEASYPYGNMYTTFSGVIVFGV